MNGGRLRATTLVLQSAEYHSRQLQPLAGQETLSPIVTVTGMPGSGSEVVAAEIARLIKAKLVNRDLIEALSIKLNRTVGEIQALEASFTSDMGKDAKGDAGSPWERYGAMDYSAELMGSIPTELYLESGPFDYLTKEEYLAGLNSVIRESVSGRARGAARIRRATLPS